LLVGQVPFPPPRTTPSAPPLILMKFQHLATPEGPVFPPIFFFQQVCPLPPFNGNPMSWFFLSLPTSPLRLSFHDPLFSSFASSFSFRSTPPAEFFSLVLLGVPTPRFFPPDFSTKNHGRTPLGPLSHPLSPLWVAYLKFVFPIPQALRPMMDPSTLFRFSLTSIPSPWPIAYGPFPLYTF